MIPVVLIYRYTVQMTPPGSVRTVGWRPVQQPDCLSTRTDRRERTAGFCSHKNTPGTPIYSHNNRPLPTKIVKDGKIQYYSNITG